MEDLLQDSAQLNRQAVAGEIRVRFGPGFTQTIPLEWAESILSAWRERSPKQFGDALAQAALEAR